MKTLEKFFGDKMLSFVTGQTCREYAGTRSTEAAARRELEELRAAINHHRREGLHDRIVSVVLPPKSTPREDWLECEQAAALIWRAWRYREVQEGDATVRYTRRHVARFMIFARYMGSRASVICNASIEPVRPIGLPWCDLRHGVFYGLPQGQRETKKRRQKVRIPTPLLAHLRRCGRKSSGSLAILAAIRRASSRVARHLIRCGPYSMALFWFPREDATADHNSNHCGNKNSKL
jgi:hypothetical protein